MPFERRQFVVRVVFALAIAALGEVALGPSPTRAQTPTPPTPPQVADVARPPVIIVDGAAKARVVGLTRASIEASIVGSLAETRMTLTFGNTSGRALAGDLYVPLPANATVSGYALDVAGRMVDGVVVAKDEARRIFEIEVRKGVDPGLVEWTRGNVFKTRVFPIPANGSRTVRLTWVAPLDVVAGQASYALPLAFKDALDELTVRVEVVRGAARPVVSGGAGPIALTFDERLVAEAKVAKKAVVQDLRIAIPDVAKRPAQVETSASGTTWFMLRDEVPPPSDLPRMTPRRVRVLWDASLSRAGSDHAREIALLRAWLTKTSSVTEVELVVLRNEASTPRRFALPAELDALARTIAALDDDGGTQLARLAPPPGASAVDLVLVFSDGLSTFGDDTPTARLGAPAWFVSTGTSVAHDALARLAADYGGAHLDLARIGDAAALDAIGRPVWSLLSVAIEDGRVEDVLPGGLAPVVAGASTVTGVLGSERARVRVGWGVPGAPARVVRTYEVQRPSAVDRHEVVRRAWAQMRLADLMAQPAKNAEAITELGKAHGIVTPGTSLLVLESLDQYLTHRVRPPASWPELRKQWDTAIEERAVAKKKTEAERLDQVAAMWRDEVAWYEQRFDYPEGFRYGGGDAKKSDSAARDEDRPAESARPEPRPSAPPSPEAEESGVADAKEAPEKAKKSASEDGKDANAPAPEPGVAMAKWDPQTPWTRALKAAAPGDRYAVYVVQRKEHGAAPSFYLDCADVFLGFKDEATALQILSNIAELRLDEPALLRVLAHRLAQLGQLGTAATIFREVLRLRPEEPQSQRDLALVLGARARVQKSRDAARADWQEALDHLALVIKTRWDRFEAIEIIALHELNNFWTQGARDAGARWPLDDRFMKAMQLDARIVMTWDADATDMDLHVVEPSQEEAYYGHNLTTIGGKVSRDFTQGYGPEIYGLKRAMRGTYKVKTKFYGSSAAQLIGAVTLQVDVFTNWGRENQAKRSMTLRLTESKEEFVVGELEF